MVEAGGATDEGQQGFFKQLQMLIDANANGFAPKCCDIGTTIPVQNVGSMKRRCQV